MIDLHRLTAEIGLALTLLAAGWLAVTIAIGRPVARLAIINLAWVTGLVAIAALLGLVVLASGPGPHDALHLVYAVLAVVALPLTAWIAAGRPARHQAIAGLVGSIIELILVVRLFQTGA